MKNIPIFLTITDSHSPYAAGTINSIIKHSNPQYRYQIFILHDNLTKTNETKLKNLSTENCSIDFYQIANNEFPQAIFEYCIKYNAPGISFYKPVCWYRYLIPTLFPNYDKCIYLDSDTILMDDVSKLFSYKLGKYAIGAIRDKKVQTILEIREYIRNAIGISPKKFVNSGVMLMNLKEMRRIDYISILVKMIKKYNVDLLGPDQEYMNVILRNSIKTIPYRWNTEPAKKIPKNTKIIHYNLFNKPWHYKNAYQANYFWDAVKKTDFYQELSERLEKYSETDRVKDLADSKTFLKKGQKIANAKKILICPIN